MALVQLGIQNNYSKQSFLMKSLKELRRAQSRTTQWTTHEVTWMVSGKPIWYYQSDRIQSLEPSGLEYLYFLQGAGPLLVIYCTCMSHELLKHMDWHSQLNWPWVLISSIPRAPTGDAGGLEGTNGTERPRRLKFPWHINGNHIVSTWKPHGVYVDTTWFLHGHHVVSMWTQHSYHMDTTWFPGEHNVVTMCFPCAHHVVSRWSSQCFKCGHHMISMWKSHCFYVDKTWFPYGHHVVTMWTQCGYHMVSRWTPYGFYVDTMWFPCAHHVVSR